MELNNRQQINVNKYSVNNYVIRCKSSQEYTYKSDE